MQAGGQRFKSAYLHQNKLNGNSIMFFDNCTTESRMRNAIRESSMVKASIELRSIELRRI